MPPLPRFLRAFRAALAFLTILPVRFREGEPSAEDLEAARLAFPMVGVGIGLALAGLSLVLERLGVTGQVAAVALLTAGVAITGGLHLDGLADTCDGLFLAGGPVRRLSVMKDPHVGSFGVIALILTLLGKAAVLADLGGSARALSVLGAAVVGRSLILVAAGATGYARPEGTGRVLVRATTPLDACGGGLVVAATGWVVAGPAGFGAGLLALILALVLTALAARRLGGVTGDVLGAVVELGELAFLIGLAQHQVR